MVALNDSQEEDTTNLHPLEIKVKKHKDHREDRDENEEEYDEDDDDYEEEEYDDETDLTAVLEPFLLSSKHNKNIPDLLYDLKKTLDVHKELPSFLNEMKNHMKTQNKILNELLKVLSTQSS